MPRDRRRTEPGWGSLYPLLDLHGMTAEEAIRRADSWLRAQRKRGERTVVLVTGRGNRSPAGPVLRGEMEHLLAGLRGEVVNRWEPTQGGGAFQVQLVPVRTEPGTLADRTTARRLATADPRLRARAEEALWELGITPTPALVAAEIRRLLASDGTVAGED
jgi:hypothetical protein